MTAWREVDIWVVIDDPNSNPPKYHFECEELPTKDGDDKHFIFENAGHAGFLLNFILEGDAHGYRFPVDETEAMYSAEGVQCPKNPGQWPQFRAKEVKPGNKILVVRNLNQKGFECDFGYTLRVTKTPHDSNPTCIELDPGGTNTNGSWGSDNLSYTTLGTIAVTTALVTAVATTAAVRFAMVCPVVPGV